MSQIAERYIHLCRSYIQLSDKFQKLDVEHTALRRKVVPMLDNLKGYKKNVEKLEQEKSALEEKLRDITEKYENLKQFEILEKPEIQAELREAENQIALVEETVQEMEENKDPDLNEAEKMLLNEYQSNPAAFELPLPAPYNYAQAAST
ncbi:MAG: hypothetical protein QNJ46_21545 [Leptolyngbyaceae cyanobacterium MO_188.B28]|nr:hypothetical protein [Leptolyngbyaceae cyanobacterium MO_188.B28]